jgi:hypothetical protein
MGKKLICLTIVLLVLGLALAASATPGPVDWWKLDEASGKVAADSSGNGLDGALLPDDPNNPGLGPVWVPGQIGGALSFNGTSDCVDLGNKAAFNFPGSFTVSLWANIGAWGSGWAHTMIGNRGEDGVGWQVRRGSGTNLCFTTRGIGNDDTFSASTPPQNEWIHIACVYNNAANTKAIYINGKQEALVETTAGAKLAATTHNTYLGCRANGDNSGREAFFTGMLDDVRIYDRALTGDEAANAMAGGLGYGVASNPTPANGTTDVYRDGKLSFAAGQEAKTHDIYFGMDRDAVANADPSVLVSQGQAGTTFDPGRMEFGTTCYWRVDEIGGEPDFAVTTGNVWSFTVEPYAHTIGKASITATASSSNSDTMGPEKTIDDSGLSADGQHSVVETDMWLSSATGDQPTWIMYAFDKVYSLNDMKVWNSNQALEPIIGYGAKDVTVEYGVDPNALTKLDDVEFAQATGDASYTANTVVDFQGVPAKYVKLTINSNWGGVFPQFGLSEVQFSRFPVIASYPNPASGATGIGTSVTMSWRPGRKAAEHEVYLSYNQDAVVNSTALAGKTTQPTFTSPVELNRTYYWKVTEVNEAEDPAAWEGDVWNFKTVQYLTVYNFKDTADRTLKFDSDRGFKPAVTDWTAGGAKTLVIWFTPNTGNAPGQVAIRIGGKGYRFYTNMPRLTKGFRYQWNIDLAGLAAQGINLKEVGGFTLGVLSEGSGSIVINDIRLYRDAPAVPVAKDPGTNGLVALYAMEGNANDGSGNGNDGTLVGAPTYVPSVAGMGTALKFNGTSDVVDLGKKDAFNPTGSFSVAVWANIAAWSSEWGCVMVANRGEDGKGWQVRRNANWNGQRLCFTTRGVDNDDMASAVIPPMNEWVHIVCVYDNVANTKTIYINGSVDTIGTTTAGKTIAPTTHNASIGARANGGNNGWEGQFNGMLDDVRLYNRVLSEGEVRYLAGDR